MEEKITSENNNDQKKENVWNSDKIVKRDFWLIPIYLLANNIIPIILFILIYLLYSIIDIKNEALVTDDNILIMGALVAEIIIISSFYVMHKREHIVSITINRFKKVSRYILLIIATYILILCLNAIYDWLMAFLPHSLQYSETQNQIFLEEMFDDNKMLPLLFIDIVILTPIIEELLFRHLIIHELGKKITYGVATILSVLLFSSVHVIGATSPFEIGSYLIIAIGLTFIYLKSNMNLATSITLHALNNFISFIAIVFWK
ncbi:MAG TPA: CPBP family intramembrane glutamic endopeptidase [Staphylococcus sp.]|nr:CPBP family intramembrane glutamic endopeptidase [Staphylococcus sp.]